MQKRKQYSDIKFSSRILRKAVDASTEISESKKYSLSDAKVTAGTEQWGFDDFEEFLSAYMQNNVTEAYVTFYWDVVKHAFTMNAWPGKTIISVNSDLRNNIQTVFSVFEEAPIEDKIPYAAHQKSPLTVFIGHGRDKQWEKLKSHLQDKHEINIEAYETGARAGHTIRDILDSMSEESSIALLVLTGEDKTKDGMRARQNVIHECGLFQGRLGFDRAIMLVEQGVEMASNFDGIQQIRFRKGRISEVFGDVLATIRRESGPI